jgi:hypothetical protein
LSEERHPGVEGDQRLAGDQRICPGPGLPQGDDRQQARDADEDGGGFQDPRTDETDRRAFVLPLDHRVQHDGGADAGQRNDDLQEAAEDDGSVRAGADDVVRIVTDGAVKGERRDRNEGEQVGHARNERRLPQRVHRGARLIAVVPSMTVMSSPDGPVGTWRSARVDTSAVRVDLGRRDRRQAYVARFPLSRWSAAIPRDVRNVRRSGATRRHHM